MITTAMPPQTISTPILRGELEHVFLPQKSDHPPVEWHVSRGLTDYEQALDFMQERVEKIQQSREPELVWLVEHPPLYTAGTSAKPQHLLHPDRLPVFMTGRGGEYTYHGPGQRIAYVMLDLKARRQDIRAFVGALEEWIIRTLATFGVRGERREDRVGVWVVRLDKQQAEREDKIAAIGIRLKKWVSFHGIAVNISPDLSHYEGIVPCGIKNHGITSLSDLGHRLPIEQFDRSLEQTFGEVFGRWQPV